MLTTLSLPGQLERAHLKYCTQRFQTTLLIKLSSQNPTADMVKKLDQMLQEVRQQLSTSTLPYKQTADLQKTYKTFDVGNLVMIHLCKERYLPGTYSKLKPFQILKHNNNNACIESLPTDLHILLFSMLQISILIILLMIATFR